METSVDEIIAHFNDRVNYDDMHATCYARVERSHSRIANWKREDFELTLESDGTVTDTGARAGMTNAELMAADKATIQNYGRPYLQDGKPSGTYYKYARTERVPEWKDIESKRLSQSLLNPTMGTTGRSCADTFDEESPTVRELPGQRIKDSSKRVLQRL